MALVTINKGPIIAATALLTARTSC